MRYESSVDFDRAFKDISRQMIYMKAFAIGVASILVGSITYCDAQKAGDYIHNQYNLERITQMTPGGANSSIPTLPPAAPEVKGDVYLNESYSNSAFQLYDREKLVEGLLSKLDLKLNEFDVKTPKGVGVLKGNHVKSFIFVDSATLKVHTYVNVKEWKTEEPIAYEGFYEILVESDITLLNRTELIFKKPDFNPALNVGSKDYRFIKKEHFYYMKDNSVFEIPGKRNFSKIFGARQKDIEKYMIDKDLSPNKDKDLIKIFSYYKNITG